MLKIAKDGRGGGGRLFTAGPYVPSLLAAISLMNIDPGFYCFVVKIDS